MIIHNNHPLKDGISQIIWRLSMSKSLSKDTQVALNIAKRVEKSIEERAKRSRDIFASIGYNAPKGL